MVATPESQFAEFRASGSAVALAAVFDALAPELLLVAAHVAPRGVEPEDVVQNTFLDAIAKAASWDASRRLLPWLIGILVRNAQALGRQATRRPDPARMPPRPAPATPLDASAASDLAAQVSKALDGLPRHYRQVLTLHLVHGFTSAQIAHALACPVATVRTRLHRGLERLRALLPVGLSACVAGVFAGRGLAAVRETVLAKAAVAVPPAAAVAVGTFGGMLLMTKLVTGACAVLVAAALWMVWPRATAEATVPVDKGETVALTVPESHPPAAIAAATQTPGPASASAAERTATTGALRVEFRWREDGAAAGMLSVRLARLTADGEADLRFELSERDGVLTLPLLTPGRYGVAALEQPGGEVDVIAGEEATLRVVLEPRLDLNGIVVDEAGAPIAGAEVRTRGRDDLLVLAVTRADGRFRWRGERLFDVWAAHEGHVSSVPRTPPEGRVDLRLVLGGVGLALTGTVVDPEGAPVAGALVVFSTLTRSSEAGMDAEETRGPVVLRSDARGAFSTASLAVGEQLAVAIADGFGPALQTITLPVESGGVVLRLCRGATVRGVVKQGDVPREGTFVYAAPQPIALRIGPMYTVFWRSTKSDAHGRYELRDLFPGRLRVTAQPFPLPVVQHEVTLADGEVAEWDPLLTSGLAVRGTVVDQHGVPLVGWHVYTDVGRPLPLTTVSDAAGGFALEGLRPADYRVEVAPPAAGAASTVPWAFVQAPAGSHDVVVRVPARAGSDAYLTGRVMDAAGGVPARATVTVYASSGVGDEGTWTQPIGADGRFRLGPLRPTRYQVHASLPDQTRVSVSPSPTLEAGATLDLGTLTFERPVPFTVVLRHADGTLVREARLVLEGSNHGGPFTRLVDGAWQARAVLPGAYTLRVWGEAFAIVERRVTVASELDPRTEVTVEPATPVRFVMRLPPPGQAVRATSVSFVTYDAKRHMILFERIEAGGAEPCVLTCGMAAGEYRVQAGIMGTKQASRTFTVPADRREVLEVELDLTGLPEGGR